MIRTQKARSSAGIALNGRGSLEGASDPRLGGRWHLSSPPHAAEVPLITSRSKSLTEKSSILRSTAGRARRVHCSRPLSAHMPPPAESGFGLVGVEPKGDHGQEQS